MECLVSGPIRALEHGNVMLRGSGKRLVPVSYADVGPGNYVHWRREHFSAVKIGRTILVKRSLHWDTIASLECLGSPTQQRFFKLIEVPSDNTERRQPAANALPHARITVPSHTESGPNQRQLWSIR